jgi:hypothetical protein
MKPHCRLATGKNAPKKREKKKRKDLNKNTKIISHLFLCGHVKEGKIKQTF